MLVGIDGVHKELVGFAIPETGLHGERSLDSPRNLEANTLRRLAEIDQGPVGCQISGVMIDLPPSVMAIGRRT